MFTPSKPTGGDPFDVTLLNTPQPQATSTVQRKSTLESKFLDNDINTEVRKCSMARKADTTRKTEQSSLGILDSISSFLAEVSEIGDLEKKDENKADLEREFARKLLQKCSDFENTSTVYDTNKENNANIQNLSGSGSPSILIGQSRSMYSNQSNSLRDTTIEPSINKTGTVSVVFEPNEITARSSELSRSSEKCSSKHSSKNANAISFDTTTAEYMAQFNNEEFRPASEMASQMLADEISWQQNYSYALPTAAAAEKEYLNLSCFSGIIGELDLSVESCAGRKMSVDEFFRRKCGTIGELSDDEIQRPSLGLSVSSPKKKTELVPLVDSTIVTEVSSIASSIPKNTTQPMIPKATKDIEEQSIMSLSSIAQALQDIDNGTPRRLVDQLIMAKKKRKTVLENDDKEARNTYTLLPSNRKSIAVTPSATIEKLENDIFMNISAKLSLDSRMVNETADMKHRTPRMLSFDSNSGSKRTESFMAACKELKKELSAENVASYSQDFSTLMEDRQLSLSCNKSDRHLSPRESKLHTIPNQDSSSKFTKPQKIEKKENIKEENISYKDKTNSIILDNSNLQNQFQLNRDVVIGKSTDELCSCVVGMSRETEIELTNNSDRWVTCSLAVNDVQGDKQNIKLTLPKDMILIKPNAGQSVKIIVKIVKMCKPIIAVLNITVSDMVTRSKWVMKHIICFKPEEFDVHIPNLSQEGKLDFQCIIENTMVVLPVAIKNKNNIALPIMLSITQDEPMLFNIENSTETKHLTLKPQETTTIKVHCNGIVSKSAEMQQRRVHRLEGKLKILMENNVDGVIIIKEIPLVVQVGVCKLEVVNTDIPMVVTNKQSKPLTIINLGNIAVLVAATFVQESEPTKTAQNFFVQPENVVLQPNETGCFFVTYKPLSLDNPKKFVKIKLSVGSNSYYYSIIGEATSEERDNLRCETPQYMSSISSPTSPHSVTSNRTGTSGRNSPSSSISGSTVAGDKIPIRSTHAALMWNSVKPGKSETKEFTIRNTSNNKIKIQAVISNNDNSFRFLRERQASSASLVLVLQRTESRTLSVVFSPHRVGAATGKMYFKHYEPKREDNDPRPSKAIYLYGYGGYGKIDISEAFKDISGKMWLSLGTLNSGGSLKAKIKLQNTGDLISYAKIKLTPKAVYPTTISSWIINPTELLLHPKEIQWVTLEFRPRKEDLSLLQRTDVSHVGTLTIIHGDEPTRWRIRRLYNKMKESGELNANENEAFRNIVHPICKSFPGEQLIQDLQSIRETVQNLGELCRGVRQHEIMLTMEVSADETLSFFPDNADDSQMFYSLCSDNSHLYEGCGESFLPSETLDMHDTFHRVDDDNFTVSPSVVILNPPMKTEAFVTIRSSCIVAQPFETSLSDKEYLSVVPAEGMIPTRKGFQLKIQCKRRMDHNLNAILEIYTQNNKQDVQIRIVLK